MSPYQVRAMAVLSAWLFYAVVAEAQPAPANSSDASAASGTAPIASTTQSAPAPSSSALLSTAPATVPPAPADLCDPHWVQRAYNQLRSSIVKIESASGMGAGFVFHSPHHVATAFHVVASGRELRVTSIDGTQRAARVVAIDKEHDLAILDIESGAASLGAPLECSTAPIEIGTPVAALGHPFGTMEQFAKRLKGLLTWSMTSGVVSGSTPEYVQTDAAINPGNSGGPLVGCDGRLLGVVSSKLSDAEGISLAVAAHHLSTLEKQIGVQEEYRGRWTFGHPSFGLLWEHETGINYLGPTLGLGLVHKDRLMLRFQAGFLWGIERKAPPALVDRSRTRGTLELLLGYRFLLLSRPFPLYLVPTLGGAYLEDRLKETTVQLQLTDPSCTATTGPCLVQATRNESEKKNQHLLPMAGLDVNLAGLDLGYAFQLDIKDTKLSNHRFFFGLSF